MATCHQATTTPIGADALAKTPEQASTTNTTINSDNHSTTTADVAEGPRQTEPTPTTSNDEYLDGIKLYALFVALLFIMIMIALDAAILSTAIPVITNEFHTIADIGWYGAAYMIANSSLLPLTGKIYKLFPLKLSFFAFVATFELGSVLCATANSSKMLVVGRAVAGMGGSGLANGSLVLIAISVAPVKRPTILGALFSMFAVGQVVGPLIGGALTQHTSWRWCFWINLPIGALAVPAIMFVHLPPQGPRPSLTRNNFLQNFDIVGFLVFAPASVMFLLALQWGGIEFAWSSATVIGLLVGSAVTFTIFVMWERRQGDHALFPTSILALPQISSSVLYAFLIGGSMLVLSYYLPLWFQTIKHDTPTQSAVDILPRFLSQVVISIASGPIAKKIGFFTPIAIFGAAFMAIGTGLMILFSPFTPPAAWICYQILNGIGGGTAYQQPINTIQAVLPKAHLSTGMAIAMWAQFFGGAVCLGLAQTAFSSLLKTSLAAYAPDVDPIIVINAGATNYQNVVPVQAVDEVYLAYNHAITQMYWLPSMLGIVATFVATGMGWKRLIPKEDKEKQGSVKNGGDVDNEMAAETDSTTGLGSEKMHNNTPITGESTATHGGEKYSERETTKTGS